MTISELQSMTVIQLRKIARENNVILGAGIDKSTIVEKLAAALALSPEIEAQQTFLDLPGLAVSEGSSVEEETPAVHSVHMDTPEAEAFPAAESAAPLKSEPAEPRFQAAWHSADSPNNLNAASHASYSSTGINRPAWQKTTPSGRPMTPEQRPQPLRSHSFGPRFGPGPSVRSETSASEVTAPPAPSPLPDHRVGFTGAGAFGPRAAGPEQNTPPVSAPGSSPAPELFPPLMDPPSASPTLEELLSTGDFEENGGVLELHPDGYGFLRATNFLPSSRDIYVSMAQIRRFSLRTGDLIQGKIRPQREGDKYAALLYIDTVNGVPESEAVNRPLFDELTAVYPFSRMSLEAKEGPSLPNMRLIDLIAPLGFGQRGLLLCPPDTGKRELLRDYANTITANYPEVTVLTLLIDTNPEDATAFRDSVSCPVLASYFDQAPEAHLRLTEMVVERAMRLVEQKKDVVVLADSLTRLAKIYTTNAAQQGRSLPGMVNPSSLLRAKRLFGSARCMKEGGSLTVIAVMDINTGNKVDDSIVEEFKGSANMELTLDQSVARAGVFPAINLQHSYTKNSDLLLNEQQKEGLSLIRQMLGTTSSATAIPQLLSMMEKTSTNSELLLKMKDWFALMNG